MACYFLLRPHVTDVCWRVADLLGKTVSKIKYMGKGEIRKENKCLSLSWLNDVKQQFSHRQRTSTKFAKRWSLLLAASSISKFHKADKRIGSGVRKQPEQGRPAASEVGFISVFGHISLDSAKGGQRIEIAKYKKIENSKFLSDHHPFNIPSLLVGTVGLTLRLNFEGSGFQPGRQSQPIGVVGDVHSANLTVKKVKFSPSKRLVTCGPWQPLIAYQIFTWTLDIELPNTKVPGRLEQRWSNLTSSRFVDSHLRIISRVLWSNDNTP
jgi:hypothetical protein